MVIHFICEYINIIAEEFFFFFFKEVDDDQINWGI